LADNQPFILLPQSENPKQQKTAGDSGVSEEQFLESGC
jgi:hypothetical protein